MIQFLKKIKMYHLLQSFYRRIVFNIHKVKLQRKYSSLKGKGFVCNCCGASYLKFAPYYPSKKNSPALLKNNVVAGYGENVYCPSCMSTSRERLIIAILKNTSGLPGKNVLHLSPEPKIFQYLKTKCTITSADLMPGFYKTIDRKIQFANATQLPYDDERFDLVIANHIMEHIPEDRKAMREIYRVLKPGGRCILQVPFSVVVSSTLENVHLSDPKKRAELFGQKDHVRIYNLFDYINRLKDAGFTVEYWPYDSLSHYYQYAIQPNEGFFSIQK